MNSQTITTQANANHFGAASASKSGNSKSKAGDSKHDPQSNGAGQSPNGPASAQPHHEHSTTPQETTFRLEAPSAREVLLAGEFTNWDKAPVKLIKGGGGIWHTKIPLAPGRHFYRFLVDGQWQDDPNRPGRESNPFGTENCFVDIS